MDELAFSLQYTAQSDSGDWSRIYQELLSHAQLAERVGYNAISVAEHHFGPDGIVSAPEVILGGLASVTDTLQIGSSIIILPLHHPVAVAERAIALDLLSEGRSRLGVGLGWQDKEFEVFGVPKDDRTKYMVEHIELIKRILSDTGVSFDGDLYSFEDLTVTPRPVQDSIPIWYGGQAKPAVRRAAHRTDSWLMSNTEPLDDLAEANQYYAEALENAGRSYEGVWKPLRREAYVAEDDETAWEEVGDALLSKYRDVYDGYTDIGLDFSVKPGANSLEQLRKFGEGRFLIGSPETVVEEIKTYQETLDIDELVLQMHFSGMDMSKTEESIRLVAEEVMPEFQS